MVDKIATGITAKLVQFQLIDGCLMEEYSYAIETMIERYLTYAMLLLLSIQFRMFVPTIFFMTFFLALRGRTGGFHASSFLRCLGGTIVIYVVLVRILYPIMQERITLMYLILGVSVLIILIIGTVNHPNMDMTREELKECKKSSRMIVCLETICIVISVLLGVNINCIIFATFAIVLCATLLCLSKLIKQEVTSYESE